MYELDNKSLLIVGGASGIGRAVADMAVSRGASVMIASRNENKLIDVVSQLGERCAYSVVDMTDEERVKAWSKTLPEIDYLIVTASSATHGAFATAETKPLRAMFDAKFFGPYITAREVLPRIKVGGGIMLFSGVLSRRPGDNCAGLGAVNGAIEALTRAMALELGPEIRVNCLSPGMVRSEAYDNVPSEAREKMYTETGASLPVGRVGVPSEIAHAVLATVTNTYLTGQILDVDGGHMIRQFAAH